MIPQDEILDLLGKYDRKKITVATLGSHSALQILKGAREAGFKTLVICREGREIVYERFRAADEIIILKDYKEVLKSEMLKKLQEKNCVFVPHGSLIAYVGAESIENELRLPLIGNRGIFRYEADRSAERRWLEEANIKMPKETKNPREISALSIVKFPGAKGGRGYFLVSSHREFIIKSKKMLEKKRITEEDLKKATIQEYIPGVNVYISYFYSPLKNEVELFGMDRRYEANIDGMARIPAADQTNSYIEPSYVVVGNAPIVARESLLGEVFRMGDRIVEVSKKIAPPGMLGAFCLETMVTHKLEFIAFEISTRIVAGTNPFTAGSPYSYLLYGNNMSMGRRIAVELKNALREGKEKLLIT
jgi:5-formaminoimidazole-4-carboxamide-1-(beta)-D-ribofuranosyl 5'-monophosphate synthetase